MKQLLNLGVGDTGRLEHIKSALEENKILYSSDRMYVEKLIEQYIQHEDKLESPKDSLNDKPVEILNHPKKNEIFSKKREYKCTECDKKFKKYNDWISHAQILHNQTIHNCSLCNVSFLSLQSMIEHTKEKHYKVKIGWQIFFIFVPFVGLWAYHRIKRLGDGILLSFGLAGLLYGGIFLMMLIGWVTDPNSESDLTIMLIGLSIWPLIGVMIWLKIHYMIKWSREWNKKIDSQIKSISKEEHKQD